MLLAAFALAVRAIGHVLAARAQARLASAVGGALRVDVVDALVGVQPLRAPRHEDQGVSRTDTLSADGATAAALTTHARDVEEAVARGALGIARAILQLLPLAIVAVALSPRLAALALVVWAPLALVIGRARKAMKRELARAGAENETLHGAAAEVVRHADLWRTYGARARVTAHVRRLGASLAARAASIEGRAAGMTGANEVLGALALAGVVALARAGVLGVRVGDVLPFMAVFFLAYKPVREWNEGRLAWSRGAAALARVAAAVPPAQARAAEEPRAAAWSLERLVVRGVSAPPGLPEPLAFEAPAGSIVAVVGPTGSGKTTLLRALLGLEARARGEILYGGKSMQNACIGPAGRPFAWAPQDAPVVADSVAANVALAGGAAQGEETSRAVAEALSAIGAPLEPSERVGAGGRALSGGERLWVSLARALASGQPVLLLDEPTTGLDDAAARRVLAAVERLRGRRTVILVTHDPRARALADRVVDVRGSLDAERAA